MAESPQASPSKKSESSPGGDKKKPPPEAPADVANPPPSSPPKAPKPKRTPASATEPIGETGRPIRDRKPAEIFRTEEKEQKTITTAGKGVRLGDQSFWTSVKNDDLVLVHRVLLGRPGSKTERKANLADFRGIDSSMTEAQLEKRILNADLSDIKEPLRAFGLSPSGTKAELANRLAVFLAKPTRIDTKIAPTKAKKSATPAKKRNKEGSSEDTTSAAKKVKTETRKKPALPEESRLSQWVMAKLKGKSVEEIEATKMKALRKEAEEHFDLEEGDLSEMKDVLMRGVDRAIEEAKKGGGTP